VDGKISWRTFGSRAAHIDRKQGFFLVENTVLIGNREGRKERETRPGVTIESEDDDSIAFPQVARAKRPRILGKAPKITRIRSGTPSHFAMRLRAAVGRHQRRTGSSCH
jgi:hypothetical protein